MSKKVLIVEDEFPMAKALAAKMQEAGFVVRTAKNGKKGLAVALESHPDLILLDIVMPVMDGVTMLEKLREDSWGRKVKVLILTNLNYVGDMPGPIRENVQDYLIKTDWKLQDIVAKAKEMLA